MSKLLVLTNMFPTPRRPSDGIFVKETADVLRATGAEIDVLCISGRRTPVKYGLGVIRLRRQLRRKRYDLVHAFYGYSGIVAAMQSRVPVILTLCGSDVNLESQRRVSRIAARSARVTIVQTTRMKELLGHPDALVLPFGVDLDSFSPTDSDEAKARLGLDKGLRYALFPYDPSRRGKRYGLYREAVEEAVRQEPRLRQLTLGGLPREVIPLYMSAADVLVITSEAEGSPNTVKEALACGLPVVSVDVGDVRENVAGVEGCWICDADRHALADAIVEAVRFGRTRGRERAELLSSKTVGQKLVRLYEGILYPTQGSD